MKITWLLTKHLQRRYGDCSRMSINRRVRQGRLPTPQFPFSNHIPAWIESELDAHDLAVAAAAVKSAVRPASDSVAEIAPIVEAAFPRSRAKAAKAKTPGSRRARSHEHS